ncbi:hypothetical protein [Nostoc sp. CCY0012]|uniref:hypothetical protein n=1 Tax=Nostoc sp. CCY0012 TaxID=1056123 RepID=UPI0039C68A94
MSTESRRLVENDKRVRYYRLNTEDVVFARKVLEYRQRQREKKERKGQEEQAGYKRELCSEDANSVRSQCD